MLPLRDSSVTRLLEEATQVDTLILTLTVPLMIIVILPLSLLPPCVLHRHAVRRVRRY